jgi:hypothetical protein
MDKCTKKIWIKKMWYLYTMDFFQPQKNEILSFSGKWMELGIILREVSQAQKAKNCMFSLMCGL